MDPVVWDDAIPRIQATADLLGIPFKMPNEDGGPKPIPPVVWVQIEMSANTARVIELRDDAWEERGQIWIILMVPIGAGQRDFEPMRVAFSNAFRGINLTTPAGLVYTGEHDMDPLQRDHVVEGMYIPLPLCVRYKFNTHLVPP